ncbi:MAG TPA: DUF6448 family protein [Candidatus Sulfotelmatobacter sp.]|nr:DUF6448 family protein [Candidatus Sulfotelmatobacter sp.]
MIRVFPKVVMVPAILAGLLLPTPALAHCDTMDGPVVTAAKLALNTGEVTPVLKWVPQSDEFEIRTAFERALKVRALSPEAREMADNYFYETLVRVHRAGEGEPYAGLKPAGTEAEPGIRLADQALETGSADDLVKKVTSDVADGIRARFVRVREASRHADQSVNAGREYVAAYVEFIHYVENIHETVKGSGARAHLNREVAQRRVDRQP